MFPINHIQVEHGSLKGSYAAKKNYFLSLKNFKFPMPSFLLGS